MHNRIEYKEGELINGFIFIKEAEKHGKERAGFFECPHCLKPFESIIKDVKGGRRVSCGCYHKPKSHGMSGTKLAVVLKNMKQRCYNKKHKSYKNYGLKGITICNEWLDDPSCFFDWAIHNGYQEGLEIDRIDNLQGYSPDNCRFITKTENLKNKIERKKYGYIGVFAHSNGGFTCKAGKQYVGWYKNAKDAAIARDAYIVEYGLDYQLNFK